MEGMEKIAKKKFVSAFLIVILIVLFVLLFSISRTEIFSQNDSQIIGNFIEWFGVLYGVMLALVVVEVWRRYNLINNEVDREADALVLLLKTARYLGDSTDVVRLAQKAKDYANAVIELGTKDSTTESLTNLSIDAIHNEVGNILKYEKESPVIISEIMRYLNEAYDLRGDRLTHVRERMPKELWVMVIFTSLVWIIGFFGLQIENDFLAAIMCGVAAFTVSALVFIVADLEGPDGGRWKTSFESFEVLRNKADKVIELSSKAQLVNHPPSVEKISEKS